MTFSEKLLLLRKQKGLSQDQLAELLDVSRQSVSKWEAQQTLPEPNKLILISDLFGVSVDQLLRDDLDVGEIPAATVDKTEAKEIKTVPADANPEFVFCTKCGKKNNANSNFCQHCGHSSHGVSSAPLQNKAGSASTSKSAYKMRAVAQEARPGMLVGAIIFLVFAAMCIPVAIETPYMVSGLPLFGIPGLMFLVLRKSPKESPFLFGKQSGMKKYVFVLICVFLALTLFSIISKLMNNPSFTTATAVLLAPRY